MAAAHDQAGALDADLLHLKQTRIEVVGDAADDEVVAGGQKLAGQHVAGLDLDVDLDAGKRRSDLLDGRHDQAHGRRGDGADIDRSALAGSQFGDLAAGLAQLQHDLARTSGECLAEGREHHAAGDALIERRLHDRLHFRQHSRCSGLGNVQRFGSGRNLAAIFDCDDHAQVIQLKSRP
jgi:hypothetical protein